MYYTQETLDKHYQTGTSLKEKKNGVSSRVLNELEERLENLTYIFKRSSSQKKWVLIQLPKRSVEVSLLRVF